MTDEIIECKYRMSLKLKDRGCIEHRCVHYQHVLGKEPQTGEVIDHFMCSDLLANKITLEGNKLTNEVGAALESFRNEVVKASNHAIEFIPGDMGNKIGHN